MSATKDIKAVGEKVVGRVGMKLEVEIIPVSDVDRSKAFYERLGWRLDDDAAPLAGLRIVQFTPPGSATSVTFGEGLTTAPPGSATSGLVVTDIEAAHKGLSERGFEVSDIWHGPPFPAEARLAGIDPKRSSYGSFFSFSDLDGNLWIVQEVTTRLPGRVETTEATFGSIDDLEKALRRAEAAHVGHQERSGRSDLRQGSDHHENWAAWYAAYLVAEQTGHALPT